MIQIVDSKRYDTEKATLVYGYTNGRDSSDVKYREKNLYLTKNGAWFIYHVGGERTDMVVFVGNKASGGSAIEPIPADDAYGFLEAHSDDSEALAAMELHFAGQITEA